MTVTDAEQDLVALANCTIHHKPLHTGTAWIRGHENTVFAVIWHGAFGFVLNSCPTQSSFTNSFFKHCEKLRLRSSPQTRHSSQMVL
mmetsp:Transcript_43196/g.85552  ORF Transcript_43196/g.85552 Transcript_43196/m.85552 type:complete len:87 (-) Transcript_43196:244-504(-)